MLTNENYCAWNISPVQYPRKASVEERLKFLLRFAVLAPSGHNSQPWLFRIEGNTVKFLLEKSRSLEESDPSGRQLMISFGCALENFLVAAHHFGFHVSIDYRPVSEAEGEVLSVTCYESNHPDTEHLISGILHRHTDRGPYKTEALNPVFVEEVKQLDTDGSRIFFMDGDNEKERLLPVISQAQVKIMDSTAFRNELAEFVKSSYTNSKTGIPGFALGLPGAVSIFASWLVKKFNLARLTQKQDEAVLRKTPAYMVIATHEDEKAAWIKAGRLFEHVWLMAVKHRMVCSPMAAIIQDRSCRKALQHILHTDLMPQVFFRIGYAVKPALPTPRFMIEDLLTEAESVLHRQKV